MGTPDGIQLLVRLGLTLRQAKVYLTLAQYGVLPVKGVSDMSHVHREDLYRVLGTLQKMGLVKKRIKSPITYEAIALHEAFSFLQNRRIRETEELRVKQIEFLAIAKENLASETPEETDAQFVLIPKKEAAIISRKKAIKSAERSIDVVNPAKKHLLSASIFGEEINKALDRGVKIRVIIQKPEKMELLPKAEIEVENKPSFKIRYISANPSAIVSIFDNKEVLIIVDKEADINSSALWSNNHALVTLSKSYFDSIWHTATVEPFQIP